MRFIISCMALVSIMATVDQARAVSCSDPAVLQEAVEQFKCARIAPCGSKSADFERQTDAEISAKVGRSFAKAEAEAKSELERKVVAYTTERLTAGLIDVRELFKSIRASAKPIDFDPTKSLFTCQLLIAMNDELLGRSLDYAGFQAILQTPTVLMTANSMLSEGKDPIPFIKMSASMSQGYARKCWNYSYTFTAQPTIGTEFLVKSRSPTFLEDCSF